MLTDTRQKSALRACLRCARMELSIQSHPWGPHGPDQHLGSALKGSPEKTRRSHPIIKKGLQKQVSRLPVNPHFAIFVTKKMQFNKYDPVIDLRHHFFSGYE